MVAISWLWWSPWLQLPKCTKYNQTYLYCLVSSKLSPQIFKWKPKIRSKTENWNWLLPRRTSHQNKKQNYRLNNPRPVTVLSLVLNLNTICAHLHVKCLGEYRWKKKWLLLKNLRSCPRNKIFIIVNLNPQRKYFFPNGKHVSFNKEWLSKNAQ